MNKQDNISSYAPLLPSFILTVRVTEGRDLAAKDPNGRSDPYCLIGVPSSSNLEFQDISKCARSETQFWNLSPTWKKGIFSTQDDQIKWVRVEVWDKDFGKNDDFMGYATIEIKKENTDTEVEKWVPLKARSSADGNVTGEVHIIISITASKETKISEAEKRNNNKEQDIKGVLKVRMLSASGVPPVDETNSSDPYCILGLSNNENAEGDKWIGESKRTKVVCSTCNPSWDNDALFEFEVASESQKLIIELWDKANVDNADFQIGRVVLPLEDITHHKHTTLYKPKLIVDPDVQMSLPDVPQATHLNFSCLYIPNGSVHEEDEWMLPRHERPAGKALIEEAERLVLSKQRSTSDNTNNSTYTTAFYGFLKEKIQPRMVRVFVSSTFTDTEKERNLLMEDVYPFMQRLCKVLGMEFETVDMRWGVRQETTLSHNTSNLCMSEIEKCVTKSFGPAFLCILGDKYGYRPFPAVIHKKTLDAMWTVLCDDKIAELKATGSSYEAIEDMKSRGIEGTQKWEDEKWQTQIPLAYIPMCFKHDYNIQQPHYILASRYEVGLADDKLWWPIFEDLQKMLRKAAKVLSSRELGISVDDEATKLQGEWRAFEISVTEEEVINGILHNKNRSDQSICVLRAIKDVQTLDTSVRRNYVDVSGNTTDTEAVNLLGQLKSNVQSVFEQLPDNIVEILISQNELDPTKDLSEVGIKYRKMLCDTICGRLASKLLVQFESQVKIASPLYDEVVHHLSFREEKLDIYVERPEYHQKLIDYLTKEQQHTLVIKAPSGAGKTALIAWASKWASQNTSAIVITRFLGTSPQSSDVLSLLQSLCFHLIEVFRLENITDAKGESWVVEGKSVMQLASLFKHLMKEAESVNKLLVIFLDSLDQLSPAHGAHNMHWLPLLVLPNMRIVVSVLIPTTSSIGSLDSSMKIRDQLQLLSTGTLNEFTIHDMGLDIAGEVLNQVLGSKQRTLTEEQKNIVFCAFKETPMPLYLQIAFNIAQHWHSYTPLEHCVLDEGMRGIINQVFSQLEKKHGETLISRALSYLIESRNGLSSAEMENILSCDENVLSDIFEWWTPPVRRLPPLLWKRILEDLGKFVVERGIHGVTVHSLYHRQFREAVKARYVSTIEHEQNVATHLAKFFNGDFSSPRLVPFINKKAGATQASDRLIEAQPLQHSSVQFNRRKLSELPYLQTKSGDFRALASSLFSFEFIEAKATAGMLDELEEDYETALQAIRKVKENNSGGKEIDNNIEELVNQFSHFVRNKRHVIRKSPKDTLLHALNGPSALEITKVAHNQWKKNAVHSNKIIYQFINKPRTQDPCTMTIVETGRGGGIEAFCLNKNFSVLVASTFDGNIKQWDMRNGHEIITLSGHSVYIRSCSLASDDTRIISACNTSVRIWDRVTGNQISLLPNPPDNKMTQIVPMRQDSKIVYRYTIGGVFYFAVFDVEAGKVVHTVQLEKAEDKMVDCTVSPNDQLIATVEHLGRSISVYDLYSGKLLHRTDKPKSQGCVFISNHELLFGDGNLLQIWNLNTNKFLEIGEHQDAISACTVSGNTVVSASIDGTIIVWDMSTRRQLCSMRGHSRKIFGLKTDGKTIVSGVYDQLKVWDIPTAILQQYSPYQGKVLLCKVVKRGVKTMAIMRAEGDFYKAWNIDNGNMSRVFRNTYDFIHHINPIQLHAHGVLYLQQQSNLHLQKQMD